MILDFCVKTRNRFSLRDKRLFEIIEVEITRVDCILKSKEGQRLRDGDVKVCLISADISAQVVNHLQYVAQPETCLIKPNHENNCFQSFRPGQAPDRPVQPKKLARSLLLRI